MKLKSLFLGSVAAVGLSTSAFAADVAADVLTSLDVCDELGFSGLTISSETNCLQISGGVEYRFRYGDYGGNVIVAETYTGNIDPFDDNGVLVGRDYRSQDWDSRSRAWVNIIAAADSDFGPARAHITLRQVDEWVTRNEGYTPAINAGSDVEVPATFSSGDHTNGVVLTEAYVSIGDSTVLMAGKKADKAAGSVANIGDDNPYSFLFISDKVDGGGVLIDADDRRLGGHSIQITSDLGNGIAVSAGLENLDTGGFGDVGLDDDDSVGLAGIDVVAGVSDDSSLQTVRDRADQAGTAVGVLEYSGEGLSAHVTGIAYGILDGTVEEWAVHAGAAGTFEMFKVTGAIGYSNNYQTNNFDVVHGLVSAEAGFDIFTLALSGEFASMGDDSDTVANDQNTDYSVSGDIGFAVTEGVSLNLEGAYFHDDDVTGDEETYRVRASASAEITETLTVAAAVGGYFGSGVDTADETLLFGDVTLSWAPGGNFTSSIKGEVNDEGGYRAEFNAAKTFD